MVLHFKETFSNMESTITMNKERNRNELSKFKTQLVLITNLKLKKNTGPFYGMVYKREEITINEFSNKRSGQMLA